MLLPPQQIYKRVADPFIAKEHLDSGPSARTQIFLKVQLDFAVFWEKKKKSVYTGAFSKLSVPMRMQKCTSLCYMSLRQRHRGVFTAVHCSASRLRGDCRVTSTIMVKNVPIMTHYKRAKRQQERQCD